MTFHIREADWSREGDVIRSIRTEVFILEQQVPESLEWDAEDPVCLHILARTGADQAIGTARLLGTGQIGRLAVLKPHRGHGAGRAMLGRLMEIAERRQFKQVFLNAQTHAVAFYRAFGFRERGTVFNEAGIPHVRMEKKLTHED